MCVCVYSSPHRHCLLCGVGVWFLCHVACVCVRACSCVCVCVRVPVWTVVRLSETALLQDAAPAENVCVCVRVCVRAPVPAHTTKRRLSLTALLLDSTPSRGVTKSESVTLGSIREDAADATHDATLREASPGTMSTDDTSAMDDSTAEVTLRFRCVPGSIESFNTTFHSHSTAKHARPNLIVDSSKRGEFITFG